jgi:hypothetical protein
MISLPNQGITMGILRSLEEMTQVRRDQGITEGILPSLANDTSPPRPGDNGGNPPKPNGGGNPPKPGGTNLPPMVDYKKSPD